MFEPVHQSLGEAVLRNHIDVVEYLVKENGIDAHLRYQNSRGENVLHLASMICNPEIFHFLAPRFPEGILQKDCRGDTPLLRVIMNFSASGNRFESARILLSQSTDWHLAEKHYRNLFIDPKYSYADIFLCHAEMYSFACRTGWTALCYLSLYRLLGLLVNCTLCEERTGDIVTLFKFAFEDVNSEEFESIGDIKFEYEGMGDIKKLMGDYLIWNLEILMRDMDFQLALDKMPSLENALFRWMWR
jgi:hypothetical protein